MSEAARLAHLLDTAGLALRDEILPVLDEAGRAQALRLGEVMALAAGALRDGGAGERDECRALQGLLGAAEPLELDDLRARIVAELRAGLFDGEREVLLLEAFRARLGRSTLRDHEAAPAEDEPSQA